MSNSTLKMKNQTPLLAVPSRPSLRLAPVLVIAALMAFCPTLMRADTIAFNISDGVVLEARVDATFGYAFTLSSSVTVTQLGIWDQFGDGLGQSHAVTIWTSSGMQEVQATIPAGTGTTLTNGFRYVSIVPFTLAAGTYTIAGFYNGNSPDFFEAEIPSITGASGVSYFGSRSTAGFVFPTADQGDFDNGYFGPNFQFTEGTGVPDTGSTFSLLGFASLGLVALRRKLGC